MNDDEVVANDKTPAVVVRRKEFVARVVASSGLKPNAVKTALDAILKELGDALSQDETMVLPPLGRLSVNRKKERPNGEVIICKLRRPNGKNNTDGPLAEAAE